MTKHWIVSWIYNGEDRTEEFEFQYIALARMIQLEAYGLKPSLHFR